MRAARSRAWASDSALMITATPLPANDSNQSRIRSIDPWAGYFGLILKIVPIGIAVAVAKIGERGWQGNTCMITPDEAGRAMLEKALKGTAYDCVVIGGGLRIPPKSLVLFEMVVNAVHKAAPGATIAFNLQPANSMPPKARRMVPSFGRARSSRRRDPAIARRDIERKTRYFF
jgi:hypothetical protein